MDQGISHGNSCTSTEFNLRKIPWQRKARVFGSRHRAGFSVTSRFDGDAAYLLQFKANGILYASYIAKIQFVMLRN